jgi:hypothetical protein
MRRFSWRIWAYGFCIVFMGVFVNLTVRKVSSLLAADHLQRCLRPQTAPALLCAPSLRCKTLPL